MPKLFVGWVTLSVSGDAESLRSGASERERCVETREPKIKSITIYTNKSMPSARVFSRPTSMARGL